LGNLAEIVLTLEVTSPVRGQFCNTPMTTQP